MEACMWVSVSDMNVCKTHVIIGLEIPDLFEICPRQKKPRQGKTRVCMWNAAALLYFVELSKGKSSLVWVHEQRSIKRALCKQNRLISYSSLLPPTVLKNRFPAPCWVYDFSLHHSLVRSLHMLCYMILLYSSSVLPVWTLLRAPKSSITLCWYNWE